MGCYIAYFFGAVFAVLALFCFFSPWLMQDDSQPAPDGEGMMAFLSMSIGLMFALAASGLFSC